MFYPASEQTAKVGCLVSVYTLTEGTEQTKEAKRSPKSFLKESYFGSIRLSPDFPI